MIALAYLAILLMLLGCMAMLDRRFRLVFWADDRRAALVVGMGAVVFLLWDIAALVAGFYHRGQSPAMTGILLAPDLPLEELVFIVFLCYLTLIIHGLVAIVLGGVRTPRRPGAAGKGEPQ